MNSFSNHDYNILLFLTMQSIYNASPEKIVIGMVGRNNENI